MIDYQITIVFHGGSVDKNASEINCEGVVIVLRESLNHNHIRPFSHYIIIELFDFLLRKRGQKQEVTENIYDRLNVHLQCMCMYVSTSSTIWRGRIQTRGVLSKSSPMNRVEVLLLITRFEEGPFPFIGRKRHEHKREFGATCSNQILEVSSE